ncbi:zinc transporter [Actinomyces timonensis]|uniref:Zinc transporter n=1 Tax=Actinomyces timonensis TaxID=1288391 RepID=A0AAU8MXR2_9ACTO
MLLTIKADPGPASALIVVTSRDVATLIVDGPGITLQPPGSTILVHMPLIAYTNPATRSLSTTVGGVSVDVEATPTTYAWHWGDATTTTTTDPGHPYPHHTTTHLYATTADGVTVTLTTTWTARYRPTGTTNWQPVNGYLTTTQTSPPFNIRRLVPYLTDDAEHHHNH